MRPWLGPILLSLLTACGQTTYRAKIDQLVARPLSFNRALFDGALWKAHLLYRDGSRAFDHHEYGRAYELLSEYVRRYPEGELLPRVHLKLGLTCRELNEPGKAADYFSRYLRQSDHRFEPPRHFFFAAEAYAADEHYHEALFYLDQLEGHSLLSNQDTVRLALLRGFYAFGLRHLEDSERQLLRCLDYIDTYRTYLPAIEDWERAKAYHVLGEIQVHRALHEEVRAPEAGPDKVLGERAYWTERAEYYFRRAIEVGDTGMAMSSLQRIAELYLGLYRLLLPSLVIPASVPRAEADRLRLQFRQEVGLLAKKAQHVYQRAWSFAKDVQELETWLPTIEAGLAEVEVELAACGLLAPVLEVHPPKKAP